MFRHALFSSFRFFVNFSQTYGHVSRTSMIELESEDFEPKSICVGTARLHVDLGFFSFSFCVENRNEKVVILSCLLRSGQCALSWTPWQPFVIEFS